MKRYYNYLKYILKHKYYVGIFCRKLNLSLWQALLHDWTKFLPSEFIPYAKTFYSPDGSKRYVETLEFSLAWRHHQRRNAHHWQYWLLTFDRGETIALDMPDKFIKEMVADWCGAGLAITGKLDVSNWYQKNKDKIILSTQTRIKVEQLISEVQDVQE